MPLAPVCSLLAIAEAARQKVGDLDHVCTVADARMREVYAAAWRYRAGAWEEMLAPMVARPNEAAACFRETVGKTESACAWGIVGDGLAVYPELESNFSWRVADATVRPTAQAVGSLALTALARGELVAAAEAAPLYVRQRVALTSAERAAGEVL